MSSTRPIDLQNFSLDRDHWDWEVTDTWSYRPCSYSRHSCRVSPHPQFIFRGGWSWPSHLLIYQQRYLQVDRSDWSLVSSTGTVVFNLPDLYEFHLVDIRPRRLDLDVCPPGSWSSYIIWLLGRLDRNPHIKIIQQWSVQCHITFGPPYSHVSISTIPIHSWVRLSSIAPFTLRAKVVSTSYISAPVKKHCVIYINDLADLFTLLELPTGGVILTIDLWLPRRKIRINLNRWLGILIHSFQN